MKNKLPDWLDPIPWAAKSGGASERDVLAALGSEAPGLAGLAALLSPAADRHIERIARRALDITRRHFGRTISLYIPLYLSNYCSSGCAYCGYAADRKYPRRRLDPEMMASEMEALRRMGFEEILLLTGERTPQADYNYVRQAVAMAAEKFQMVTVETFPMSVGEYKGLTEAGCEGITIYQETYDPAAYARVHRWGPKRDFMHRLETPARALEAGMRFAGLGALLGLSDPVAEAIALFRHVERLRRKYWQAGFSISFPRIRPQAGGFKPSHAVGDLFLAKMIFALRICLPEVHLVLSTRESPEFRDGVAGIGITKMSIASRTTVGGYRRRQQAETGQFDVADRRGLESFQAALRGKGLQAVFKNWDISFSPARKPGALPGPPPGPRPVRPARRSGRSHSGAPRARDGSRSRR